MPITRRHALSTLLAGGALASCSPNETKSSAPAIAVRFIEGVASGDPQKDRVIIWSRVTEAKTGTAPSTSLTIDWEVARDENFSDIITKGSAQTGPGRDGTIKVDVTGLEAGKTYFYRFIADDALSPTGRTKTLPSGKVDNARFAIMSCSNYPFGFFNVYDDIAKRDDLDAVIHLGDYIYEYGRDGYGGETGSAINRDHLPSHEILTLADYRARHRQYRSDMSAQAMHGRHPLIAIWDDHETANNSWQGGAENHDPQTEGKWAERQRAALQAYYEWMPVREPNKAANAENPSPAFFRSFSFGDLLTIAALETRLMARSEEITYEKIIGALRQGQDLESVKRDIIDNPSRQLLGTAQSTWLENVLRTSHQSGQPWRLIANQIIMARVTTPDLSTQMTEEDIVALEEQWDQARAFVEASTLGLPSNFDAWDGYPAARERFYDMVKTTTNNEGMIVVTGDTHTWWANDLINKEGIHMGVELGTHSVTSPSPYRKEFLGGKGAEYAYLTTQTNQDVRYLNGENHGYIDIEITHAGAEAKFMAVNNILNEDYESFLKISFAITSAGGPAKFAS